MSAPSLSNASGCHYVELQTVSRGPAEQQNFPRSSSEALAKLADKIATLKQTPGSGTFDQIKNMIQKMIFHLMSEQKDEDDHKNWCSCGGSEGGQQKIWTTSQDCYDLRRRHRSRCLPQVAGGQKENMVFLGDASGIAVG